MESYFYHRFKNFNLETLLQVLKTGFILPRNMIVNGLNDKNNIFNGDSHISLVQKTLMTDDMCKYFRSAYIELIQGNLCVVISPEIEGIVYPDYIDFRYDSSEIYKNSTTRYSYYMDEVQTPFPISITKFLAVGYPLAHFKKIKSENEIEKDLSMLERALINNELDIPIIDSTNVDFADDKEKIKLSKIKSLR